VNDGVDAFAATPKRKHGARTLWKATKPSAVEVPA
jgi:hypothetical protein